MTQDGWERMKLPRMRVRANHVETRKKKKGDEENEWPREK
jgi:hypothetical protein